MPAMIYIVEDDESIRMLLEVALRGAGCDPRGFGDAAEALEEMRSQRPDACVLDIMMDGMDGITMLKTMRQSPGLKDIPVLMLTAKNTETDKVVGLDSGADDYMTKPFGVLEFCARVRALLRRGKGRNDSSPVLIAGPLRLQSASREVSMEGNPLQLTFKEFELLMAMMLNSGKALTREELLQDIWGYDFVGETRTLDMHVGTLRHKLGDDAENPTYIKTVRGIGYRFIARVQSVEEEAG